MLPPQHSHSRRAVALWAKQDFWRSYGRSYHSHKLPISCSRGHITGQSRIVASTAFDMLHESFAPPNPRIRPRVPDIAHLVTPGISSTRSFSSSVSTSYEAEAVTEDLESGSETIDSTSSSEVGVPPSGKEEEQFLQELEEASMWHKDPSLWDPMRCRALAEKYDGYLNRMVQELPNDNVKKSIDADFQSQLLSSETVIFALKVLLKCQLQPEELATRVREWEKALGQLKQTPLTDHLSLRLLTANGKAGNVGRVLALLGLRKSRQYEPRDREFIFAIKALRVAQSSQNFNVFLPEAEQSPIDYNPTRWLDAILVNMHQRGYPLTTEIANHMLQCYASGYTGRAIHHFYRVVRRPVAEDGDTEMPIEDMPHEYLNLDERGYRRQPVKVNLSYNPALPPFYKKPSENKGKLMYYAMSQGASNRKKEMTRSEREQDPGFSPPLAAAFAFADSLLHGACGHKGIEFNTQSYNALITACVQRGALWRAVHVLDDVMPQKEATKPTAQSYNLLLAGFGRVGDVVMAQEYVRKMINTGIKPDAVTVREVANGLLNLGDAAAAVTVVQDFFNQHSVLPPYTTHLKILEVCLAREMLHEAKRYVYFIQQLWYWEPNDYHSDDFIKLMRATQRNEQLQKPALKQLFRYFGEDLDDSDFL